jgi:hypothetical protein
MGPPADVDVVGSVTTILAVGLTTAAVRDAKSGLCFAGCHLLGNNCLKQIAAVVGRENKCAK